MIQLVVSTGQLARRSVAHRSGRHHTPVGALRLHEHRGEGRITRESSEPSSTPGPAKRQLPGSAAHVQVQRPTRVAMQAAQACGYFRCIGPGGKLTGRDLGHELTDQPAILIHREVRTWVLLRVPAGHGSVGWDRYRRYRRRYCGWKTNPSNRIATKRISPAAVSPSKYHHSYPPGARTECQPSRSCGDGVRKSGSG